MGGMLLLDRMISSSGYLTISDALECHTCTVDVRFQYVNFRQTPELIPQLKQYSNAKGETIGQKISRLTQQVASKPINPPRRDNSYLATHPSDHNRVYVDTHTSHIKREHRMEKAQKRRARDLKKVQKGKMDESVYMRGESHDVAFLVPVPLYYYPGVFVAYPGACAVVSLFLFVETAHLLHEL
jgi:hypothetical protein